MRSVKPTHLTLLALLSSSLLAVAATGCVEPELGTVDQQLACGLGDEVLAVTTYDTADIPSLSDVQKAQFIAAVRESGWDDTDTIEEAFLHADDHEIRETIARDSGTNRYYVEVVAWFGDNRYGAVFYYGTDVKGGVIHDGDPYECGSSYYNYDYGDTAPACAGFLTYTNTATYAALDAYLPSNVAQNIVDARTLSPFDSVADVIAVNGVAETRLQQLLSAARTAGAVGTTCSGIYDQLAISTTEAANIVTYVNNASPAELDRTLSYLINETVIYNLLANRPYSTIDAISATSGVGPAVFRTLRIASVAHYLE